MAVVYACFANSWLVEDMNISKMRCSLFYIRTVVVCAVLKRVGLELGAGLGHDHVEPAVARGCRGDQVRVGLEVPTCAQRETVEEFRTAYSARSYPQQPIASGKNMLGLHPILYDTGIITHL